MPQHVGPLRPYRDTSPQFGERIMIDPSSVVIGHVTLGDDVSIWPLVAIRGDVNRVHVGARTNIQDGCVLHVTHCSERNPVGHPLVIGDEVTVGHKAMLHGCTIGNRVLIGMGSIILDGAVIEDEVVIGAGSLVASGKRLHSGYLYFGSPARRVRRLTPAEIDNLIYSANNYVQWKDDYLNQTDKQRPPVEER
ncbi:gamma carbonic anhydrase family protein [Sodalis praecaptivus]|uniref:gamma carbonic anhydrase family protein n=1 Tax=Sodalis praecaptivus TaxID=1239307 RepID=UPI0027F9BD50|nr:gamma carbonic anhydrase family protein [Sodalis praecaptivus]CAJ0999587.1 Protein YrdA [Sodalis praecaptivus]